MRAILLLTLALLTATPALAQKSADTLRVSWREAIPDVDPYHNPLRNGLVVALQAWDGLIARDPDTFALKPLLATSWRYTDETTLEFELRPGVTFHNGDSLTADDVVYTVNNALSDPLVAVPSNYAWLAGAEKIDDLHVRIRLKRVFPAVLEYIATILPILPAHYRTVVGPKLYSQYPVGAGPYRITRVRADLIEMERYEGYYAGSPKGRPAIGRISIRQGGDAAKELDDLLAGQADWIWQFLPDNAGAISRTPGLQELRAESMRVGYLSMDAAGRTGADNPLTNLKVRQAIVAGIDRASIARTLVQGGARVPDAPCFPTQFGCDGTAAVRTEYNPARARALLAEAGYPNGFDTTLVSYVLPQYTQAVATALSAIGIRAEVQQLPLAEAIQRSVNGQAPLYMGSWGSYSINDVSAFLPYFFTGGGDDYARNPEVASLIEQAGATINPDQRRVLYGRAIKLITEQALWLPLHTYVTTYGISRTLAFKPSPDELPRFYLASWR